jgi:hypothetical protein
MRVTSSSDKAALIRAMHPAARRIEDEKSISDTRFRRAADAARLGAAHRRQQVQHSSHSV